MAEAEFVSEMQIVLRLCVAAVLGCLVGADRERHEWTAGMRTYMLVAVGACLAMIVSINGFAVAIAPGAPANIRLDPSRVIKDYVVQVEGNPDLFLGKAFLTVGPARVFSNFFLLERDCQTNFTGS